MIAWLLLIIFGVFVVCVAPELILAPIIIAIGCVIGAVALLVQFVCIAGLACFGIVMGVVVLAVDLALKVKVKCAAVYMPQSTIIVSCAAVALAVTVALVQGGAAMK